MFVERKDREELKALSMAVFGVSSKWQQYVEGVKEIITHEVEETIPAEYKNETNEAGESVQVLVKAEETRMVKQPLLKNGSKQTRIRYYTVEETKALLLDFKAKVDAFKAAQAEARKAAEEKQKQADHQKKVAEELTGSSL